MDKDFDRPNEKMRDVIDAALRLMSVTSQWHAAADMDRAGVPLRVIARVLQEPERRRPVSR